MQPSFRFGHFYKENSADEHFLVQATAQQQNARKIKPVYNGPCVAKEVLAVINDPLYRCIVW